jgi:hypothetical protein
MFRIANRFPFVALVSLGSSIAGMACTGSGDDSSANNVTCGPGTSLDGSICYAQPGTTSDDAGVAVIPDATLPMPETSVVVDSGMEAIAPSGPTFGGATALAPASLASLLVTWNPATEAGTDASAFTYRVYLATTAGGEDFAAPTATSAPGATSFVIDKSLTASAKYYVVVRAVDAAGHEERNSVEQSATTQVDITPPLFEGVTSVMPAPEASLTIAWHAATDDLTPAPGIVYDIFLSTTQGGENLSAPDAVSAPGATSITINGLPQANTTYYVVVRAVDAAGNVDTSPEGVIEKSGKSGTDDIAPVFSGCQSATKIDAQSIAVTWAPASDNSTPAGEIVYDVYAATTQGGQDFTHPTKQFRAVGGVPPTGGLVDGLNSGTTYYLVCRARDLSGNEDQNIFARVASTAVDGVPPTFAGVTGVRNVTASSAELYWNTPATDDQTPSSQIVYVVYQAATSGGEIFGDAGAPVAFSMPGASSITISNLTPATTYYWVVLAMDRAGNVSALPVLSDAGGGDAQVSEAGVDGGSSNGEVSATTLVSWSHNVIGIFAQHCAVTNCHIPGTPPGGLVLAPSQSYQDLVGVAVTEFSGDIRVIPGNAAQSYVYLKITGTQPFGKQMPPPSTNDSLSTTEINFITTWINQGALQN